jgi:hypothetical protein
MTKTARSRGPDELEQLRPLYAEIKDRKRIEDELLIELLKVADIRVNEADSAKAGFSLLGVEVFFVALYLGTIGCVTGNMLGARATQTSPSLRLEVAQVAGPSFVAHGGNVTLGSQGAVQVRAAAHDPAGLRSLKLAAVTRYQCPRHTSLPQRTVRTPIQEARVEGAHGISLVAKPDFRIRHCSGKHHKAAGIAVRLSGTSVNSGGARTTRSIGLHAHP